MKLIYKPFGIVLGILAGLLSKKVFEAVWGIYRQGGAAQADDAGGATGRRCWRPPRSRA